MVFQQWDFPGRRWTALYLTEWLPELLFADLQPQVPSNLGTFFVGQPIQPRILSGYTAISAETFNTCGYVATSSMQEFQGDKPVQGYVLGLVDHTPAATTKLLDDAVVRDGLANHRVEES